jgi:predicted enzyme related to lactoylglutathione lyase
MTPPSPHDRQIDYVEFGVANIDRAKQFYGTAFGWRFTDHGDAYCEFADGRLTGGFTTFWPPRPGGPLVILYGDDLEALVAKVAAAGGTITAGGRRFHFTDPDGYELAVWSKS